MRNFTIYLVFVVCLFVSKMAAQQIPTFEERAKEIAVKIETITKEEKAALKVQVEAVNNQLVNGDITKEEADSRKRKLAEATAINIESKVAMAEDDLKILVQEKVDGKILENDTLRKHKFTWNWSSKKKDTINYAKRSESRTTSQFVFAIGMNNLVTDGQVAHSDYKYPGSRFYEWGTSYNTRLMKNNNLLHLKYGLSVMYNDLRATDNRMFVDNGKETTLETNAVHMKDSRFRNVNLVVPFHLEFDFSGKKEVDGKTIFKTHQTFRFGIGGYAGVNLKSKQIIKYDIEGYKSKEVTKGGFNTNDFIYGLSTYIGYKETSLYLKYDLNPLFKDNAIKQNNVSLGIRFDIN